MTIEELQADAAVVQSVENFAEEPQRVWTGVDRFISKCPGVSSHTVSIGGKFGDFSGPSSLESFYGWNFFGWKKAFSIVFAYTLQETEQRVFSRTTGTRVGGPCQSACGSFGFQEEYLIIVAA